MGYYIAIVMYGVIFMLGLVWFVFAQMWRWCYDGQVCSGDFLSQENKDFARQHNGIYGSNEYLIAEGNFLEGVIITVYGLFALLISVVLILALFCSQKKSEAE